MAYGRFDVPKERLTLGADQVLEYSAAAQKHYRPDYPYHNWNHALSVASGTEIIASKLEDRGLTIAKGALAIASAWHDAGYHENHTAKGFDTKELYSAALLEEYLSDKPVGDFEKSLMLKAIIATHNGHDELRTPYELVLHRADIANIGGPLDEFIESSIKLWREHQHITDLSIDWEEHVYNSAKFIEFTAQEHDHESIKHLIDPQDTTLDVNDLPFSATAQNNLTYIQEHEINL